MRELIGTARFLMEVASMRTIVEPWLRTRMNEGGQADVAKIVCG